MNKKTCLIRIHALVLCLAGSGVAAADEPRDGILGGLGDAVRGARQSVSEQLEREVDEVTADETEPADTAGARFSAEPSSDPGRTTAALETLTAEIQALLRGRGFDPGRLDGVMDEKTRDAICHYQLSADARPDPRATPELREELASAEAAVDRVEYTAIMRHQCNIAHLKNLNNLQATELHSYEGALSVDDYMCAQPVAPFELQRNFAFLGETASNEVQRRVKDRVRNIFGRNRGGGDDDEDERTEAALENAREAAKKANWLPPAAEMRYGETLHERRLQMRPRILSRESRRSDIRSAYEEADLALASVLQNVTDEIPFEFKLFIVDDETVNAEAAPGGYLYVNKGVIGKEYQSLVIGHEVAHVLKRHTTREIQARLIDSVETTAELANLLGDDEKDETAAIEEVLLLRAAVVGYSQNQELQADACAVRITAHDAPEGEELIDAYVTDLDGGEIDSTKNTSTHPAYPDREKRMLDVHFELRAEANAGGPRD